MKEGDMRPVVGGEQGGDDWCDRNWTNVSELFGSRNLENW